MDCAGSSSVAAVIRAMAGSSAGSGSTWRAVEISVCINPMETRCGVASSLTKPGSSRRAAAAAAGVAARRVSPIDSVQAVATSNSTGTPVSIAAARNCGPNQSKARRAASIAPGGEMGCPSTSIPSGVSHQRSPPLNTACGRSSAGSADRSTEAGALRRVVSAMARPASSARGPVPSRQRCSIAQVLGPTTPSTSVRPALAWKATTARRVAGPKQPSTTRISRPAPAGSACSSRRCSATTSSPRCIGRVARKVRGRVGGRGCGSGFEGGRDKVSVSMTGSGRWSRWRRTGRASGRQLRRADRAAAARLRRASGRPARRRAGRR